MSPGKQGNELTVLKEHTNSDPISLSVEERDRLRALVSGLSLTSVTGHDDLYIANPGSAVGAVQLGERRFELRPKLPIRRLLFVLSYSMDPKHWRQQGFDYEEDRDLYEAIVPGFAFQLEEALREGPLVGYRPEEEALQTVRGRIRFDDQLRYRFGLIPPIECRYEEFSEDIEINRQLKAALDRLSRIRLRSTHTKRRLRTLRAAFGNVSPILYDPRQLPEIQFNRLNDHFRRPTEFARLILRSRSLDIRAGAVSGAAMVLDMSGVFEDFVVKALREALGLSGRAFPQQSKGRSLYLAEDHHLLLKPDLSWWEGNRCVFVGDAKYKKTPEAGGVRHPDMYQLLAYATATELPTGMLIYAAGETEERVFDVANTDKKLEVRTLDLDQHPDHVLTQVASLASRIQEMRSMAAMAAPISPDPPVGQQLV